MRVRRALPWDAGAIAATHVAAWRAAYRGLLADELLERTSVAQRERFWRRTLAGPDAPLVFVAEREGAVAGFCAVSEPSRDEDADPDVAEIAAIYVEPAAWRSGIGRALMQAALDELRAGMWRGATLWVLAENRGAREFYAQFGFAPDGSETVDARIGELEVRLRVGLD
jgi:GNAT superfamily N-acetyltransferase